MNADRLGGRRQFDWGNLLRSRKFISLEENSSEYEILQLLSSRHTQRPVRFSCYLAFGTMQMLNLAHHTYLLCRFPLGLKTDR